MEADRIKAITKLNIDAQKAEKFAQIKELWDSTIKKMESAASQGKTFIIIPMRNKIVDQTFAEKLIEEGFYLDMRVNNFNENDMGGRLSRLRYALIISWK